MSKARAKGSAWETRLVGWLQANGFPDAARIDRPGMNSPRGDIDGVAGWLVEAKHRAGLALESWYDQIDKKARGVYEPVVVTPWANHATERAWCVIHRNMVPFFCNGPVAWRYTPHATKIGPLLDAARSDAAAIGSGLWAVYLGERLAVVELGVFAKRIAS